MCNALSIHVFDTRDNDRLAFQAEAGRMGFVESADIDFLGFASGAIGASYVVVHDAALRLVDLGARVVFRGAVGERVYIPFN